MIELIKEAFDNDSLTISQLPFERSQIDGYQPSTSNYLTPESLFDVFLWPPNTFAVCAKFLYTTGAYKRTISGEKGKGWTRQDRLQVQSLGHAWKSFILTDLKIPMRPAKSLLNQIYTVFCQDNWRDISVLGKDSDFVKQLLILFLAADQSFDELDTIRLEYNNIAAKYLRYLKMNHVAEDLYDLSISQNRFGTVHYKHCVCQSGISLNSMSHNLAYIKPDIDTLYVEKLANPDDRGVLNLLIYPWPEVVEKSNFQSVSDQQMLEMDDFFGFFEFSHDNIKDGKKVTAKLSQIREEIGEVDLIVLPECAMTYDNAETVANSIFNHYKQMAQEQNNPSLMDDCPTLVTGVFKHGSNSEYGANALMVHYVSAEELGVERVQAKTEQKKHHRWFLDRPQIFNYKLGNALTPSKKWWEYIEVSKRSLISYYCERHNYQMSPLICEDLARQDPVGSVVRALGPNLIIALLLDGPQLRTRWPGRYASVLADDPGGSVLSVTPLGMTLRADGSGFPPSRVVALWSEPGKSIELSLDEGKEGILLTLEKAKVDQWTADGRKTTRTSLQYAGHVSV